MHKYSCDSDRRDYVSAAVMLACMFLSYGLSMVITTVLTGIYPIPNIVIFFLVLSPLILWVHITDRLSGLFLMISGIQNCSGKYTGILKSSYDSFEKIHNVKMEIIHKFRSIEIRFDTDTSTSHSVTASLHQDEKRVEIVYTYENGGSVEKGLHRHIGTGIITLEGQIIKGMYYTHPDRGTSGTFELKLNSY